MTSPPGEANAAPPNPALAWSTPAEALRLLAAGRTVRAAGPVSLLVGSILSALNQGWVILSGDVPATTIARIAVNFAVPFCVASYGLLAGRRSRQPGSR